MSSLIGLPHLVEKDAPLEEIVNVTIKSAKDAAVVDGNVDPSLVVIGQMGHVVVENVPEGHYEMAKFFTDKVEEFRGAHAYVFVTESWTLEVSTDDEREINKYINNPDSIAENPFKEECISFHAATADEALEGSVRITRDDAGHAIIGETKIEQAKEHFSNVADLLIPMVK